MKKILQAIGLLFLGWVIWQAVTAIHPHPGCGMLKRQAEAMPWLQCEP